jgi:hypothetical protein
MKCPCGSLGVIVNGATPVPAPWFLDLCIFLWGTQCHIKVLNLMHPREQHSIFTNYSQLDSSAVPLACFPSVPPGSAVPAA